MARQRDGECDEKTGVTKMLNVKTLGVGDINNNNSNNNHNNSQSSSQNESHLKLQYVSLETINVTRDVSSLSRSQDNEKDEVVLFDASGIWTAVPPPQRALLSSLQLPVEQLPKRSSPLPSIHGDEVTEPNLSRIGPMVPDGSGHIGAVKWHLWNAWDFCVLSCLRQCASPRSREFKGKFDESN